MIKKFLGAFAVVVAVFSFAGPSASAHTKLVSSNPGPSSTLNTGPPEIILFFNEEVDVKSNGIELFDSGRRRIELGDSYIDATDGKIVRAKVPEIGPGTYVVNWRVTSGDGHVVDGAFPFSVGGGTIAEQNELLTSIVSGEGGSKSLKWAMGVGRFLSYLGMCVLLGIFVFTQGGDQMRLQRIQVLWLSALALLLVGSIAVLVFYGPNSIRGGWADVFEVSLLRDTLSIRQGKVLIARVLLAMLLVFFGIIRLTRERVGALWQNIAALGLVGVLVSFAMFGHSSTLNPVVFGVTLDALHLGTVGTWLGGLAVLVLAGRSLAPTSTEESELLSRFARLARIVLPIGVVTGAVLGWQIIDDISRIGDNNYTKVLLVKVVAVTLILIVSALARLSMRSNNADTLRRAVAVEFAVGAIVLSLTAGITGMSPNARDVCSRSSIDKTVTQSDTLASISVSTPCVGNSFVHLTVSPPSGSLTKLAGASGRMVLLDPSAPEVSLDMITSGINHWTATTRFSQAGQWTLEFIVDIGDGTTMTFTTTVEIVTD